MKHKKDIVTITEMRERIKSYAEEDEYLINLNWDKMSNKDIKYYFKKYLDDGSGQGHL